MLSRAQNRAAGLIFRGRHNEMVDWCHSAPKFRLIASFDPAAKVGVPLLSFLALLRKGGHCIIAINTGRRAQLKA